MNLSNSQGSFPLDVQLEDSRANRGESCLVTRQVHQRRLSACRARAARVEVPPGKPGPEQWKTRWETAGQPRSIGNLCREPTPATSCWGGWPPAAPIDQKRAPHKPLLLLWLFGQFAATGSSTASYQQAEEVIAAIVPPDTPNFAWEQSVLLAPSSESWRRFGLGLDPSFTTPGFGLKCQ